MLVSRPTGVPVMAHRANGRNHQIYRCFVIYSRSWKIALLPILMWLADVACSVMIIFITATLRQDTVISQQHMLKPFLLSFFIVTIALNFLTTGMSRGLYQAFVS